METIFQRLLEYIKTLLSLCLFKVILKPVLQRSWSLKGEVTWLKFAGFYDYILLPSYLF